MLSLQGAKGYFQIRAKALVNATGPWVEEFIKTQLDQPSPFKIRQVQGSHLVVKRLYEGDHAYILQNNDRRIVFTIPYLNEFTLIGTTDQLYTQHLDQVEITSSETDYLLEVVNAHFKSQLRKKILLSIFRVYVRCVMMNLTSHLPLRVITRLHYRWSLQMHRCYLYLAAS